MEHRAIDVHTDRRRSAHHKRSWLVAIGCGLPLVALVLLLFTGVSWGTTLFLVVLFLCPLMHLLGMHGDNGGHGEGQTDDRVATSEVGRHH